jgi:Tfp pilus assembly protein PilO
MANQSLNTPYIVLTGVVVVGIAMGFLLFQPLLASISQTQTAIASTQQVIEQKRTFLSGLDQKKSLLASQADAEKKLAAMLPENDQMEDVLRILQVAANESGGIVSEVQNSSATVKGQADASRARGDGGPIPANIDVLGAEVQFSGSYGQMRTFLAKVAASSRLMDVQAINLERDTNNADIVHARLVIHFYKEKIITLPSANL